MHLRAAAALTPAEVAKVLALSAAATATDGTTPLSEHVMLHLRHGDPNALHLLAEDPGTGELLGYAHLDLGDPADGPAAELAVRPSARRQGVGTALLDVLVTRADQQRGRLRLWAHGGDGAAAELAATHGFRRIRRLWKMRRPLDEPLEPATLPPGIALRAFDPARDVDAWLAVNARAFADLPDQGGWDRADLERRMAEPWFDPEGFLLAERTADGRLVGFHWTKVHGHDGTHGAHGPDAHGDDAEHLTHHDPIGEVYVVGVDPDARGGGLGRALTLAGLHHLRELGLGSALLYVDADNAAAIALYTSLGFTTWDVDTLFRR